LTASLFFYAWSGPGVLPVLCVSIVFNYFLGRALGKRPANAAGQSGQSGRKRLLALGVAANLLALVYFKYLNFAIDNLPWLSGLGMKELAAETPLPLGISFFTFQAVAYLVDIYRQPDRAETSFTRLALSISFFPKITAGPIARHAAIAGDLAALKPSIDGLSEGAARFVMGLAKKVLIAGPLAPLANEAFSQAARHDSLDAPTAWVGLIAYGLQIYFDFSGYTDMAVGLGSMFGVRLPENFNYPYASVSVQDFWRRWHISLSSWLRDYLYIPLGGSRCSKARTYCNLVAVFVVCGLWHGAAWTFVAWGLWHGVFLAVERAGLSQFLDKCPKIAGRVYAVSAVMFGWVFFRAAGLRDAFNYLHSMFGFTVSGFDYYQMTFLTRQALASFALAALFCAPLAPRLRALAARLLGPLPAEALRYGLILCLLAASVMQIAVGVATPFIYAKF
ncbi:MAG: MBOAT family protein, partial [Desulfovibrionaceae bacterium]|nr:MBOAT family protein [Desulfovibrionaceae bacterium]